MSLRLAALPLLLAPLAHAAEEPAPAPGALASQVTQHGITWTFATPRPVGRFVTGDPWVVGPVTITSVSPAAGPDQTAAATGVVKSRYGVTALQEDTRMRNGSMVVLQPARGQAYDSRLISYDPALALPFPLELLVNRSLISTVSQTEFPTTVLHADIMWASEKTAALALRSAAILTCLAEPPPADAFRPPYAGDAKPIHRLSSLRWDVLPRLAPPEGPVPPMARYARYLARPWLDHLASWTTQHLGPSENQVNYGREFSRITATAGLLLMLDVPRERKQALAVGLVQLGIDLAGLAESGRVWSPDGGHWIGRKLPVLLAGILLDDPSIRVLVGSGIFSEDRQTYYGQGWAGQTALYQIGLHTRARPPHEHKSPADWDAGDKLSEGYRLTVSGAWPGTALAVRLLDAQPLWNHDAFLDYCDRWMETEDPHASARGAFPRPKQEGRALDPFVEAMWRKYRPGLQEHPAGEARQWVWNDDGKTGRFIANPKPIAP